MNKDNNEKGCKVLEYEFIRNKHPNNNPGESIKVYCPFYGDITEMKTDVKWLKKGFWIHITASVGIPSLILAIALKYAGLI